MVTLRVQMSAGEPLAFQWLHDGTPITGATNTAFSISGMTIGNAGLYTVTVRNSVGTVANACAALAMFTMQSINGTPRLTVAAPTGSNFRLDYSDKLGIAANWQTLTNFIMMRQVSQTSDLSAHSVSSRFYRAVMLP
jgi:hypothetical protein